MFVFFCSTSPSLLLFRVCSGRRADGRLAVRVFPALRPAVPVQHDAEAVHQRGAEPEGTHLLVARAEEGAEHYAARAAAAGSLAVSAVFPVLLPAAWEIRGSSFCCLLKKNTGREADVIRDEETSVGVGSGAERSGERRTGAKQPESEGVGIWGVAKLQSDALKRPEHVFVLRKRREKEWRTLVSGADGRQTSSWSKERSEISAEIADSSLE